MSKPTENEVEMMDLNQPKSEPPRYSAVELASSKGFLHFREIDDLCTVAAARRIPIAIGTDIMVIYAFSMTGICLSLLHLTLEVSTGWEVKLLAGIIDLHWIVITIAIGLLVAGYRLKKMKYKETWEFARSNVIAVWDKATVPRPSTNNLRHYLYILVSELFFPERLVGWSALQKAYFNRSKRFEQFLPGEHNELRRILQDDVYSAPYLIADPLLIFLLQSSSYRSTAPEPDTHHRLAIFAEQ